MENQEVDNIVNLAKNIVGEKPSRGREYMEWIDTKPKVFLSFRDWMFTYHPSEV